ncbi:MULTISPECIES: hypothetical protein [unclassified Paenibacillus]|nr:MULTISPECIES: hypothetical protein [unclassified Paenibacillus]MBP1157048.1 hypothetical protein [Paenibacillus sp. PvP091]MBP1172213.1 hypothetical protein [Paenibacillus sp. PvR098]MBP2438594.1 hypothetical protein [Paenibacillus sp. PvP052]
MRTLRRSLILLNYRETLGSGSLIMNLVDTNIVIQTFLVSRI